MANVKQKLLRALVFIGSATFSSLWAQAPQLLNFQGKLSTGGAPATGIYNITFAIYSTPTGATALWSETQNNVSVDKGLFNVLLGSGTPPFPNNLFTGTGERYLGIKVGNEVEMTPRFRLASAAFAIRASEADGVADGAIVNVDVSANAAISGAKINPDFGAQNIATSGRIGIGTTAPTAKLHLAGTPGLDGIRFPDGSIQYYAATGSGSELALPFVGTTASSSDAFSITTTGAGRAGYFEIKNPANSLAALRALGTGSGSTIYSSAYGTALAGDFEIVNANNSSPVILSTTNGTGDAAEFRITHPTSPSALAYGENISAAGYGAVFNINNANNNKSAVQGATNSMIGDAAYFYMTGTTGAGAAVRGSNASSSGYAGYFNGRVHVAGTLSKSAGSFKIDHPLDPANKYLSHSFVESPDMMNLYNGNVALDANGEATVELPAWFETLNQDFRYQLTCVGGFAPVYIAQEIQSSRFKIAGGKLGLKISWQVTGIRQDAYANAHRIPVEEEKLAVERGHYLHPELYGQPEEKSLERARNPEGMKAAKSARQKK